jgi:guanylate kinase
MKGIILYGPPACGKDTITLALTAIDHRCSLFRRLKAGQGKSSTYRIVTEDYIHGMSERGEIAWLNLRYGALYAVDTPELRKALAAGIPVVHLGQVEAVSAVKGATPGAEWLVVALWCSRDVAHARLQARSPSDVAARLEVWDDTPRLAGADLEIDTGRTNPADAARAILRAVTGGVPGVPGVPESL